MVGSIMPSQEAYRKYYKLLFGFDYNRILTQTDLFTSMSDQIEYLLFVLREAKRIMNTFNLSQEGIIRREEIFDITPKLESEFLSVIKKYPRYSFLGLQSTVDEETGNSTFEIVSGFYQYIDRTKACVALVETEIHYRQHLEIVRLARQAYPAPQEELFVVSDKELVTKIKWLRKEEQLLKLFSLLNKYKFMEQYEKAEILEHFAIYDSKSPITLFCNSCKKFHWFGSDNEFCFLLNQLVKKRIIPAHKKYKIVGSHFLNREGSEFVYLAQKHNFTKNYLQSKPLLIDIVNEVDSLK
jgi:hypothetical protein